MRPKSHYRNMTPARARQIRDLYFRQRLKQRELAERFRISQGAVSRIVSGRVWNA